MTDGTAVAFRCDRARGATERAVPRLHLHMTTPIDLPTYVSSGRLLADVERLYPKGPFSPASVTTEAALIAIATPMSPSVKTELLAFAALARAGKLPFMGRENQPRGLVINWAPGYSPAADFGDEFEETFEDTGTPYALAKSAIGLATTGSSVQHFLLADGHVAALELGAFSEWQNQRFESLGAYCWFVFHGRAAAAGRFPVAEYQAAVTAHGCARAALTFGVDEAVLPPLPPRSTDVGDWLK